MLKNTGITFRIRKLIPSLLFLIIYNCCKHHNNYNYVGNSRKCLYIIIFKVTVSVYRYGVVFAY